MAKVHFLNATPFATALNLNADPTNGQLGALSMSSDTVSLSAAPYVIAANKAPNVFGISSATTVVENFLIQIYPASSLPQFWFLQAQTSVALDLYFYLFADQVFGVDQTGSATNIKVRSATIEEQLLLTHQFASLLTSLQP